MTTEIALKGGSDITFQSIKDQVERFVELNKQTVFDYEDKAGNKEARSHVAKLRKLKKPVTEIHKREKEDALAICKKLDGQKREIVTMIDGMIEHHDKPLKVIEDREEAEKKRQLIKEQIKACWDEAHSMNKVFAQEKEIAALKAKEEAERAERQRLEREARLQEEAAEKAKLQERERIKQEQKRKEDAEKIKRDREEAEKKRKEQDKEHQKAINRLALEALERHINRDQALLVLGDIIHGAVPHVKISYV